MALQGSGVYMIAHIASDRRYVGSTVNFSKRFRTHLQLLRRGAHHSHKLQKDWDKYGEGAFEISILTRCPEDELLEKEQRVMNRLGASKRGYNVAIFAEAPNRGRKMSDEARKKISEAAKFRKPISEETRQRLRDAAKKREEMKRVNGFAVSEETRQKLSDAGKKRVFSEEVKKKISEANSGKPLSEEHRAKLSAAHKARERTEAEMEGRKKAAASNAGKKRSEDFCQRMSEIASNRSEEHRANLANSLRGRKLSEKHRKAISAARIRKHEESVIADLNT